jgi:sulfonate transport system substrate-binding protein
MRRKIMKSSWLTLCIAMIVAGITLSPGVVRAGDKPTIIRVAFPGTGVDNRPVVGGSVFSTMDLRSALRNEFKNDGIKITWTYLPTAGPGVNELYANDLADFSLLGDLPSIIGRAGGLKTHILAAADLNNLYIAVPADSQVQAVKDLKGKVFAEQKGTCTQLSAARILDANGLQERDLHTINMDNATAKAAILTKNVDAIIGGSDLLSLRDQGVARIIYTTKSDPQFTCNATLVGSDAFIQKYPDITKRIVRAYVQTAKWIDDHEQNRSEVYALWTKSGTPFSAFKEDWTGATLASKNSPLVDAYITSRYKQSIEDAKRYGLIRRTFDFDSWLDLSFLNAIVKEENLEGYWPSRAPLH